jgi:hypothetical protein
MSDAKEVVGDVTASPTEGMEQQKSAVNAIVGAKAQ